MKKFALITGLVVLALILATAVCEYLPLPDERLDILDHHHFRYDLAAEKNDDLGFRLRKNQVIYGFRHNAQGFVGEDFQTPKVEGTFRIFCLGGSTTLGAGEDSDRYSYPEMLGRMLQATVVGSGRRVEVVNAGVFGYDSQHTMIQATRLLDRYQPDLYVVMDGLNDLDAAQALPLTRLEPAVRELARYEGTFADRSLSGRLTGWFNRLKLVMFLKQLPGRLRAPADTGYKLDHIAEKFALIDFRANLLRTIRQAGRDGVGTLLVSDPMRILSGDSGEESNPSGINPDLASLYRFGGPLLHQDAQALSRETGTPYLDVQPVFDSVLRDGKEAVRRVWADDLHLTRYGYFLLARNVYKTLMRMPEVQKALGTSRPLSDEALDALLPGVVSWRPSDGSGWAGEAAVVDLPVKASDNLRETPGHSAGFSFSSPADKSRPGVLDLESDHISGGTFRVYPRLQGQDDSVSIEAVSPDGKRTRLLFFKKSPGDENWTPESAWYRLRIPPDLPQGSRLEIRLTGENAQLWRKGPAVLFRDEG